MCVPLPVKATATVQAHILTDLLQRLLDRLEKHSIGKARENRVSGRHTHIHTPTSWWLPPTRQRLTKGGLSHKIIPAYNSQGSTQHLLHFPPQRRNVGDGAQHMAHVLGDVVKGSNTGMLSTCSNREAM